MKCAAITHVQQPNRRRCCFDQSLRLFNGTVEYEPQVTPRTSSCSQIFSTSFQTGRIFTSKPFRLICEGNLFTSNPSSPRGTDYGMNCYGDDPGFHDSRRTGAGHWRPYFVCSPPVISIDEYPGRPVSCSFAPRKSSQEFHIVTPELLGIEDPAPI